MAKISIGDKLKTIFSKEKGKDICDYLYKNVILPTAKNTVYQMGSIAWAKFCNIDINDIPTLPNSHTAYSKVSEERKPDKVSYLPSTHVHGDISSISFDRAKDAYHISSFIEGKLRSGTRRCTLADVYEELKWSSEILQTDFDIGWSGASGTVPGIGVLQRGNCYYVQAPQPKPLPKAL